MKHLTLILTTILVCVIPVSAQNLANGYYKDIFMDSGMMLTSYVDLPVTELMGLSMEAFVSSPHSYTAKYVFTGVDTLRQTALIAGCPMDENGILLYPDGQPRFRMVYMNGGRAAAHAKSLGDSGRQAYRDFVMAGGSYLGSCAGMFIASKASITDKDSLRFEGVYLGLWPGYVRGTGLDHSWTAVDFVKKSPLLKHFKFEGRTRIDSVRHNGGCYADLKTAPQGTEVLAVYNTEGRKLKRDINGQPCIIAYKDSEKSGRVVLCGSHPERAEEDQNLYLMASMVSYALDGNGGPVLKHILIPGDTLKMCARTHDADPSHACIGDRQYHFFKVEVPKGPTRMTLSLDGYLGYKDFDLYLFAGKDPFVKAGSASWSSIIRGVDKKLVIKDLSPGTYYVSVFCATTVESKNGRYGIEYSGRTDVLNGVPYKLSLRFD